MELPSWSYYLFIVLLVCGSAMFSGLTLGLMSLSPLELEIARNSDNKKEAKRATRIAPVRKYGHWLLATLLLGNTLINSITAIIMAEITSGLIGTVLSTMLLLVFGEIVPQAVISRHALAVGGNIVVICLVKLFMVLFGPITVPIAFALDMTLGKEGLAEMTRQEMSSLLDIQSKNFKNIDEKETVLVKGALAFSQKKVVNVMTPIDSVFCLNADVRLDFDVRSEMFKTGHSRIPVYEGDRKNIIGMVFAKDLILLDPEDEIPVRMVLAVYGRTPERVFPDLSLDAMLDVFKTGRCQLALVHSVVESEDADPVYDVIGVVTLEDVIEELISAEIVDETDQYVTMDSKQPVVETPTQKPRMDVVRGLFSRSRGPSSCYSSQEVRAIAGFLASQSLLFAYPTLSLDACVSLVSHGTLIQIVNGVRHEWTQEREQVVKKTKVLEDGPSYVYRSGEPNQSFVILIIQGVLEVASTANDYIARPWSLLGVQALFESDYVPSFTAFARNDARLLKITRDEYLAAIDSQQREAAGVGAESRGLEAGQMLAMADGPSDSVQSTVQSVDSGSDENEHAALAPDVLGSVGTALAITSGVVVVIGHGDGEGEVNGGAGTERCAWRTRDSCVGKSAMEGTAETGDTALRTLPSLGINVLDAV